MRKPTLKEFSSATVRSRGWVLILILLLLLTGLPVAVWLDLQNLTETALRHQAGDLNSVISSVRSYYASNVVGRVLSSPGSTQVVHDYQNIPGAIPIPATLSLELGQVISEKQANISYRFISDYPFKKRAAHVFDDFEKNALTQLRVQPKQQFTDVSGSILSRRVRLIGPVIMGSVCVSCHNTHPESQKRDWKVGDVRGIQEVIISQRIATNIFAFKYLLIFFFFMGAVGCSFIVLQRRQGLVISKINENLEAANEYLRAIAAKLARYLAPQIYKSIFSGEKDVAIQTERKKLTIMFSDIADFTAITERLQPEEITRLLNEYFTAMSSIALKHGGTIDKFIGDALVIFFGDPETKGTIEDAKACVRMALEMQSRMAELNVHWRNEGTELPFRIRIGINTGFCNVGNFGSNDRMDYTIIGAETNLAARLQSIAEPGQIVLSYETYTCVRDSVAAYALPPIKMKGISREIVPYVIEGTLDVAGQKNRIFSAHMEGLDFHLDPNAVDPEAAAHISTMLREAMAALEKQKLH
jgi:class 3 adenylate cyclase